MYRDARDSGDVGSLQLRRETLTKQEIQDKRKTIRARISELEQAVTRLCQMDMALDLAEQGVIETPAEITKLGEKSDTELARKVDKGDKLK